MTQTHSAPRDADATRQRLIESAIAEFSRYGIAGARVDRIAAASKSNKAQIYHYFGNKDGLFDAAFNSLVVASIQEAPIDAANLSDYAGRLFDGYEAHPEILRLATWYRLERGGSTPPLAPVVDNIREKLAAIEQAQADGALEADNDPVIVLGLVLHLAQVWASATPEFAQFLPDLTREQRRSALVSAVGKVLQR